jgi:hypothetical protein
MLKTRSSRRRLKTFTNVVKNSTHINPWTLEAKDTRRELAELEAEQQQKAQRGAR